MLTRKTLESVRQALARQASVALIGPRQVGKTTLALQLGEEMNALYLDLEDVQERDKLSNAAVFLAAYEDRLVILDEIHRVPDLFLTVPKTLVKCPATKRAHPTRRSPNRVESDSRHGVSPWKSRWHTLPALRAREVVERIDAPHTGNALHAPL